MNYLVDSKLQRKPADRTIIPCRVCGGSLAPGLWLLIHFPNYSRPPPLPTGTSGHPGPESLVFGGFGFGKCSLEA